MDRMYREFGGRVAMLLVAAAAVATLAAWRPLSHNAKLVSGTLPAPVSTMSSSAFRDKIESLTWTAPKEVQRRCVGTAKCDAGSAFTSVRIDVTPDARLVGPSVGEINGVVVARVRNLGTATEKMYGFKPGSYAYYFVVYPGKDAQSAKWTLEEVNTNAGFAHTSIASGQFKGCGHPQAAVSKADFQSCAHAHTLGVLTADDPGWISCDSGCCTMGCGGDACVVDNKKQTT